MPDGAATTSGTDIEQQSCNGSTSQKWSFVTVGGGYHIVSQLSGKCLAISNGSTARRAPLVEWPCQGASQTSDQWQLTPFGSGYHIVSVFDGQCANISGGSLSAGAKAIQWPCQVATATNDQFLLTLTPPSSATAVYQRGYDAGLSGANLTETSLTTSNVAPSTFGLKFKLKVDDNVFAQPLYVPNVPIAQQGTHNVVYVATMNDSVYAFDADTGARLWLINLATRVGATPVPIGKYAFSGNRNFTGNLGIASTPVIDATTRRMYVVAATQENATMVYRLHAIDITSGAEVITAGAGTVISASNGGSNFSARYQTQRVSLVLAGSNIVFAFGAVELEYAGGYVGWVMAYDKSRLAQTAALATVVTGNRGGGVWQSGRPPTVDASGNIYVATGNGYGNGYNGTSNFSETVLKLNPSGGLALVDWFTPANWSWLDTNDFDLSSSGFTMIPGTTILAGGGKDGVLYLLNSASMGHYSSNNGGALQSFSASSGEFRGGPVYWNRSAAAGGPLLYNWGAGDVLKSFSFSNSRVVTTPTARGGGPSNWPGGELALSANGSNAGTGIIWANVATSGDPENNPPVPGELRAFSAANVGLELWNSNMVASRDGSGNYAKFVPPLVVNGRVYLATFSNQVMVYGLL
ncbi:MAG: RICIN domain-containing protein [Proteobacteria bacterium]|nr:RICIN domain-containing protein [Pseudomonadota bacterium]